MRSTSVSPLTRASSTSVSSTASMNPNNTINGIADVTEISVRTCRRGIECGDSTDNTDDTSLSSVNSSDERRRTETGPTRYNTHGDKIIEAKEVVKSFGNNNDNCNFQLI